MVQIYSYLHVHIDCGFWEPSGDDIPWGERWRKQHKSKIQDFFSLEGKTRTKSEDTRQPETSKNTSVLRKKRSPPKNQEMAQDMYYLRSGDYQAGGITWRWEAWKEKKSPPTTMDVRWEASGKSTKLEIERGEREEMTSLRRSIRLYGGEWGGFNLTPVLDKNIMRVVRFVHLNSSLKVTLEFAVPPVLPVKWSGWCISLES